MKTMSRKTKTILTYWVIVLILLLFSLIGLIFKEWVVLAGMFICGVFGFINLLLLLASENFVTVDGVKASFASFIFLRYLMMAIGILLSALLIYFTGGGENKYRYLLVIIDAIPYFVTTLSLIIVK